MMTIPETHLLFKTIEGKKVLAISYSQIDTFDSCPYKWYKTYVEGYRSKEKHEATSYGTVIHKTLEWFFKSGCAPGGENLSNTFNYYAAEEQIPFKSVESQLVAMKQAAELLGWLVGVFERDRLGTFVKGYDELTPMEKLLRGCKPAGIEEDFVLPYKLPKPVVINGEEFDTVHIVGSIDYRGEFKLKDRTAIYTIDWKSGGKIFDDKKLSTNLQLPIYSFYIMRKYGVLPERCMYFFTRFREDRGVVVDKDRVRRSVDDLNDILTKMYDFDTKAVDRFMAHKEKEDKTGYGYQETYLMGRQPHNRLPKPKPLCFWCDFSKHKNGTCPHSSDWDESKRKSKD